MKQKIYRGSFSSLTHLATGLGLLLMIGSVNATTVTASQYTYTATIDIVYEDTGAGLFAGAGVGATFDGIFNYGLTDSDIDVTEPGVTETAYGFFLYPSSISNGGTTVSGDSIFIVINNDTVINADDADFVNSLVAGSPLTAGDTVDVWAANADSPDSLYDAQTDEQTEGVQWSINLADFSASMYDNQDFRAVPPNLAGSDAALFDITEVREGVTVYSAAGTISLVNYSPAEVQLVPVPAAVWLFGSALGLLGWIRRKAA